MDGKQAPVAVSCLLDLWTVFVLLEPFGAFLVNYLTKNMVAVLVSEILGFYLDVILSVCRTSCSHRNTFLAPKHKDHAVCF